MDTTGKRIAALRESLKWSKTKLADSVGITQSHLGRIERGEKRAGMETLEKIAGQFGVPVSWLYEGKGNVAEVQVASRSIPELQYGDVSKWDQLQNDAGLALRKRIMTDLERPPSTYFMRVIGSSMEPRFREGDVIIVDPTREPLPGNFVIATDSNNDTHFKQFRLVGLNENKTQVFELVPLNPVYPSLRSDRDTIAIHGIVVQRHEDLI
jgi:phage repressor protein C with HTH and peptisase S24 domain